MTEIKDHECQISSVIIERLRSWMEKWKITFLPFNQSLVLHEEFCGSSALGSVHSPSVEGGGRDFLSKSALREQLPIQATFWAPKCSEKQKKSQMGHKSGIWGRTWQRMLRNRIRDLSAQVGVSKWAHWGGFILLFFRQQFWSGALAPSSTNVSTAWWHQWALKSTVISARLGRNSLTFQSN